MTRPSKHTLKFLILTTILIPLLSIDCFSESLPIQFAGFAFRGDFASIKLNYPYTYDLSLKTTPKGQNLLDKKLYDHLKSVKLKNAHFINGKLSELNDNVLVLACCLDNETITSDKYEKGYKIVIDLGAQLLLFEYTSFKLIACYPFTIELIDFKETKPTDEYFKNCISTLLLSNKYNVNLFNECAQLLNKITLHRFYGGNIKITKVVVEDRAKPFLPKRFSHNLSSFKSFVAQGFGKYLSKNQQVSIFPYTKGYAIGNKMALRFSNAEVFQLQIPEPQFSVELYVRGFKKVLIDRKPAGESWVYGSFVRVLITQPLLNKVYLNKKVKYGVTKIIPSMQKISSDWPVFQESLLSLFNKLTEDFSTKSEFQQVREVFNRCK